MASSNGAVLFPELLEELFKIVSDIGDNTTLSSCMLVCQTWTTLFYPIRFRRFVFKGLIKDENEGPNEYSDVGGYESITLFPETTFADFLDFLVESPRLCSSIAELQLESRFQQRPAMRCGDDRNSKPPKICCLDIELLWRIIALLPQLRKLDLIIHSLNFPESTALSQPPGLTLERLTLRNSYNYGCDLPSDAHLSYFLQSFDAIEDLILGRVHYNQSPSKLLVPALSKKVNVKHLFTRGNQPDALRVALDPSHLTHLDVRSAFQPDLTLPFSIFGPHLRTIEFGPLNPNHDEKTGLALAHCRTLTTLSFRFLIYLELYFGDEDHVHTGWNAACRMLSEVPSEAGLQELTLIFELYGIPESSPSEIEKLLVERLNFVDWARLEQAVGSDGGHPLLERIRVQVALGMAGSGPEVDFIEENKGVLLKVMNDHVMHRYSQNRRMRGRVQVEFATPMRLTSLWW